MTKTDEYAARAKIIVAGLAVIVVGDDDDGRFLVVNLHSLHYRALFTKQGLLISTNMSQKTAARATKMLCRNLKYLV